MKKFFFVCLIFLLLPSIHALAEEDAVLARIGGKKFMLSDFKRIAGYYETDKQKLLMQSPQKREMLLKLFIEGEVITGIAREKGFDKRADIIEQLGLLDRNFIAMNYIKDEVVGKVIVTEDDMKAYYRTHQDELRTPEMVRARHIFALVNKKKATEDDKKKAKEKLEGILKRIKAGEDMAKLAGEFSEDPASKTKGGDLGFFPRGRMVPEFDKIVFSIKSGELSEVFETSLGYHIIRIEERKDAVVEPFDNLKDSIKGKVFEDFKKKHVEEFIAEAFKRADVEFYPEAFDPKKNSGN